MISLNEQAYEHLRNMIINDELSYQQIYSETKLSKELGISRTPLRDAIHRLVQEGYIDIIPSKGFQLHQLTRQDVTDTFQVRSALESYCTLEITKQSASEKAQKLFKELEETMEHLYNILHTTQDIPEFMKYDFLFHVKIIRYLENEQFHSIFGTFMYRMQRLAALSLSHKGRMTDTYEEHRAILDCMKSGNTSDIYEITLKHMDTPKGINLEDL